MATATKKVTKPMTKKELQAKLESLKPNLRGKIRRFMSSHKTRGRRSYNDPSLSKAQITLGKEVQKAKGGSYRLAEEILGLIPRNGMSFYDAVKANKRKTA